MDNTEYEKALAVAQSETERLLAQRGDIDRRLSELKGTVDALSKLLTGGSLPTLTFPPTRASLVEAMNQVASDAGITNAIRAVFASSGMTLSISDVRKAVERAGFSLSNYVNPSAVIHNTLNRLEKQGELVRIQNEAEQSVAYALKTRNRPDPRAVRSLADAMARAQRSKEK